MLQFQKVAEIALGNDILKWFSTDQYLRKKIFIILNNAAPP